MDPGAVHVQKAELASQEKNRASAVAWNAEIRRTKARLMEEVPKLQRLSLKKVGYKSRVDASSLLGANRNFIKDEAMRKELEYQYNTVILEISKLYEMNKEHVFS